MFNFLPDDGTTDLDYDGTANSIGDFLSIAINILMGITFAAGFIGLAMGLVQLVTSRGDPKASGKAYDTIKFAVLAILISLGIVAIKSIIVHLIGLNNANITPNY